MLGLALTLLMILLAPRLARHTSEWLRLPFDGRYREPAVIALPDADGHFIPMLELHAPGFPPIGWTSVSSTGSAGGIELVETGEAGFTLVRSHYPHTLNAVAWLGEEHLFVLTGAAAPMEAFADLAGTRIGIGEAFSDTAMLADRILTAFRLEPAAETLAMPLDTALAELEEGQLDAVFLLAALDDPVVTDILASGAYALLPIPQHASLSHELPGVHAAQIPAGTFGPNRSIPPLEAGGLPTVSVDVLAASSQDAPYWHAWAIARAVSQPGFARIAPGRVEGQTRELDALAYPMHAAARDFVGRQRQLDRVERIGFVIAALFLLAGTAALQRERRRRREAQERRFAIVPYFESVEKLRHAAERAREAGELRTVMNGLTQVQQQAEDEWLEGILDTADMGNLYAAVATSRTRAAQRQLQAELAHLREQLEQVQRGLQGASRPQAASTAAPAPAGGGSRPKPPELEDEMEEEVPSILLEPLPEENHKKGSPG